MFKITGLGCIGVMVALFLSGIVGAFCWTYALNQWLVFFGKSIVIAWWQGFVLGILPFTGQLSIPVAVITFIIMLFLL